MVGKTGGHGDDLVAGLQTSLSQRRIGQRGDGQQVGARTGIDENGVLHVHQCGEFLLEGFGESAGSQPKIKAAIDQRFHFVGVEHATADRHGGFARQKWRFGPFCGMVGARQL